MINPIEPKEITIEGATFVISKIPAVQAREIICKYPTTGLPKVGDYLENERIMFKLMSYVAVKKEGVTIWLTNQELINNHVKSWDILMTIEKEMLLYNNAFFLIEKISSFFQGLEAKLPAWISKISTASSALSSVKEKQPSTN